ncbi:tRNA (N6-isopentenyl adenosine(37)-C2)-methylthiotransferase MiaB [Coriobacteriia bacterium Es71-Z0120]|uniref:tRNA (N6-isopentenyl adenosine(37)-C2)-methylthiotransferase MiaB n=1 Tax=Parvivirga hydrogeniphila TaxID=2939460 RepID=UPI002260AC91|nr:tRNA (N6-isopentenyl adenosine(37)-C2)-methylthiotransferase MiaB [Parvivirga hydrogeniphila]MCL4079626.1 tRNA (N6-isopentenyl adenosine(37)-C2)-methylthiotransferase MiaB [Parvivirga hydrogeniphila]
MQTYHIVTFGCQMNKHDSEHIAGLLESELGLEPVDDLRRADVIVFNTCAVREGAEERLRGQVATLKPLKAANPDLVIAVGGCVAQHEKERLFALLPHVDVVFGTHNVAEIADLVRRAADSRGRVAAVPDSQRRDLEATPSIRETRWHAWLPIAVGCDNFCSYCIVPHTRGRERSRPFEDVVAEAERLVNDGVVEITLLGQNVNSYGRDLYGTPRFAEVLRAVARTGVARVRFVTSHPKDLSDETLAAIAEEPAVCEYLHLPAQSGSTRVLTAMNRRYTKEQYLEAVERAYAAVPGLALSGDIIVGFPGETDEDFEDTLDLVRRCRYDQLFTFLYSPRPGTRAATMGDEVPRDVAQERFDRLVKIVQRTALEKNLALVGSTVEVLVEGSSKRDAAMLAGRTRTNKLVHAPVPDDADPDRLVGTLVPVEVTEAHAWHLVGRVAGYQHR